MPLWLATFTMTATWVDGGYLLGTAEGVYRSGIASGLQGGVCFGISLILGGLFFARRMRALEFHTLIDPFEARFGAEVGGGAGPAGGAGGNVLERGAAGRARRRRSG